MKKHTNTYTHTAATMRFPHGMTTIIIETGKVKGGKRNAIPEVFFLTLPHAYVTGTVPDEGRVVCWGNVGERGSAREAGPPVLLKATVWLLCELLFLWACVCVCVCECLSLCSSTCKLPVCLCIWKEKCVNVYLYFAVAYIQHACVLHLSTQTRCLLFWDLRQIWPSYCFLVFTTSCFLFFSVSQHYYPKHECGRGYLTQASCTYLCFTSCDG